MKCIAYISRAASQKNAVTVPRELASIYHLARSSNAQHSITGMLSYRRGYYIQVIEGANNTVNQLYSNIQRDKRHRGVKIILELPTKARYFPNWSMKLVNSLGRDTYFKEYFENNLDLINELPQDKKDLLNIFYPIAADKDKSNAFEGYTGKTLSLITWPDFTVIKQSPTIIELCAQLISAPHTYDELIESHEFGTHRQLDKILSKFEELDILKVTDSDGHRAKRIPNKSDGSFYKKMKNFLGITT